MMVALENLPFLKVSLSAVLLLMVLGSGSTDDIATEDPTNWLHLDEARDRAQADGRSIFIFVEAEWCVLCRRMKRDVFPQDDVQALLADRYHAVRIDLDARETVTLEGEEITEREFARRMQVRTTPTTIFMSAEGEVLGRMPGYLDAEELTALLRFVTSEWFGEISFEAFRQAYE